MATTPLRNRLRSRSRRIRDERTLRRLAASPAIETNPPVLTGHPFKCRLCDSRSDIQLVGTISHAPALRAEFLCYDHLSDFLNTWADPFVVEWTVVKL